MTIKHLKNFLNDESIAELNQFVSTIPKEDWIINTYGKSKMKFPMACAGKYIWRTDPNRYAINNNGLFIPKRIQDYARRHGVEPETMLINKYAPSINPLGLHQDKDETSKAPIISISLGCSATFVTATSYKGKTTSYLLEDGDVFIFSDEHRMLYHGVSEVHKHPEFKHRINLTIRQVNL